MPRRLDPNRQRRPYRKLPKEPRNALKKRHPNLFDGTDDPLMLRERLFVLHLNANGGDAPQAARDAGYNVGKPDGWAKDRARHIARELLQRPVILEALRTIQANTTKELGDLALTIRVRMLEVMLDEGRDRVSAAHLLAEMTPGALVPKESTVNVKGPTLEQMVLEADRLHRERTALAAGQPQEPPAAMEAEGIDK